MLFYQNYNFNKHSNFIINVKFQIYFWNNVSTVSLLPPDTFFLTLETPGDKWIPSTEFGKQNERR